MIQEGNLVTHRRGRGQNQGDLLGGTVIAGLRFHINNSSYGGKGKRYERARL